MDAGQLLREDCRLKPIVSVWEDAIRVWIRTPQNIRLELIFRNIAALFRALRAKVGVLTSSEQVEFCRIANTFCTLPPLRAALIAFLIPLCAVPATSPRRPVSVT